LDYAENLQRLVVALKHCPRQAIKTLVAAFAWVPAACHPYHDRREMLIETAKANGLEPFDYLSKVIARCAYAETLEHREDLLPWNIQQQG
jgi:hypothetical protein